jgi:[ribosomal protein S5]-alanine N-acetyltransferase
LNRLENRMITKRLELIPATVDLCEAEVLGREAIAAALGVRVPDSWPPAVFEPDDVERIRRQLQHHPGALNWTLHYVVLRRESVPGRARELLGVAGFAGAPSTAGVVEIGYAIAEEHQRCGYATEAVEALLAWAFEAPEVALVTATTYAALEPSIGVLRKAGFSQVGSDPRTGILRYERHRGPAC